MRSLAHIRATISEETHTPYRFVIAGLVLASNLSLGLNSVAVSPLLPVIIEDYEIARTTASLLTALPVLLRAFVALPGSLIVDRLGLKRVFALSWFMMGALALSPLAQSYSILLLLRLSYGVGASLTLLSTGPLIMQWFRSKEMPVMNSLVMVSMSLGMAVSVSAAAPLAGAVAWRSVLGIFGAVALMGAVAWVFLGETQSESHDGKPPLVLRDIWHVFRDPTIYLLVVGDALVFIQYAALTSWLPTYFHEFRGMSLAQAGYVTGLLPFVGMFAVLLGGLLTIRVKEKRFLFIIAGIMVGLGGFGSFLIGNTTLIYLSVILLGFGTYVYQPVLLTVPMELPWMTPSKIAVVWASSLTIAGIGSFIAPVVVGASRDVLGTFVPGFLVWALGAWALVAAGVLLPRLGTEGAP